MGDPWGRAENIANILAKALVGMCGMASCALTSSFLEGRTYLPRT